MCKVVELEIGRDGFDRRNLKSFHNSGVMLKSDLQACLLGKRDLDLSEENEPFKNLLKILQSYCLIFSLTKPLYKLLHLDITTDDDQFLIPCRMPSLASKSPPKFPNECYKFEFDFMSYLPQEVYVHCVCKFLSEVAKAPPNHHKDKQKLDLSKYCSVFTHIKLHEDSPLADWKIEIDESRHLLKFSVW